MPRYRVKRAGSLIGTYRKEGAIVTLTEQEARYFLPPHDDRLEEVRPVEVPPAAVTSSVIKQAGKTAAGKP